MSTTEASTPARNDNPSFARARQTRNDQQDKRKGVKTLFLGVVLFLTGIVVIPAGLVVLGFFADPSAGTFVVPGIHKREVDAPGTYYLWNHYVSLHEGKSYQRAESLPDGMEIRILDAEGRRLDFEADGSIKVTTKGEEKRSLGFVALERPTEVSILVTGETEDLVFSFSPTNIPAMLRAGLLAVFLIALGVVILLIGIARLAGSSDKTGGAGAAPRKF